MFWSSSSAQSSSCKSRRQLRKKHEIRNRDNSSTIIQMIIFQVMLQEQMGGFQCRISLLKCLFLEYIRKLFVRHNLSLKKMGKPVRLMRELTRNITWDMEIVPQPTVVRMFVIWLCYDYERSTLSNYFKIYLRYGFIK